MAEDFVESFLPRHDAAHARFVSGDPEPWLQLWSHTEPVSLFGAFGYITTGCDRVEATTREVATRLAGGTGYRNEVLSVDVHGDVAYTVAMEHSVVPAAGGATEEHTLRVTQVYRLEDGQWRIAHRHGDIVSRGRPGAG